MATSKTSAAREAASEITNVNVDAVAARFLAWIEARGDVGVASEALLAAGGTKNPSTVLVQAQAIYDAAIAAGDTSAGGDVDLTPVTSRLVALEENVPEVAAAVATLVDTTVPDVVSRIDDVETTVGQKADASDVSALANQLSGLGSKFRGEWVAGELAYSYDFSNSLPNPPWNSGGMGTGAIGGSTVNRPAYATMMTGGGGSVVEFNPEQVPELAGKVLTRVDFWHSIYRFTGGGTLLLENGTQKWTRSTGADSTADWQKQSVPLSDTGKLRFECNGSQAFITGFEIYVSPDPYMLGEYVLYGGKMWKSSANNNATTPGSSGTWVEVPLGVAGTPTIVGSSKATSTTSSVDVVIPATAQAGDLLAIFVGGDYETSTSVPAGWATVGRTALQFHNASVLVRTAVAGSAGSTVTVPMGGNGTIEAVCVAVRGVKTLVDAIAVSGGGQAYDFYPTGGAKAQVGGLMLYFGSARGSGAAPALPVPAGTTQVQASTAGINRSLLVSATSPGVVDPGVVFDPDSASYIGVAVLSLGG